MKRKALITGICGQDGAYLAEFLLSMDYEVHGGIRRSSNDYLERLNELNITDSVKKINLDVTDPYNVFDTISSERYDEVYNLAAQSFVGASWDLAIQTTSVNSLGALYILDAIKRSSGKTKFYQASTSEMYGKVVHPIQNEDTPFRPRSPYAVSKQFAHSMTVNYRESHEIFACCGILFNHESPLRGREFVTRKISQQIAEIHHGRRDVLLLGNLDSERDWGFAKEYVIGMWKMLQQQIPDDYVLATGIKSTVRDFVNWCANSLDIDLIWEGSGVNEIGVEKTTGRVMVKVSKDFFRPAEVDLLCGDASKAKKRLHWEAKTKVKELAEIMVKSDYAKINK